MRLTGPSNQSLITVAGGFVIAGGVIAFLHFGREILLPLVVAALLSFILAPAIRKLRSFGLWHTPAVLLTVVLALSALAALSYTIALQIALLAADLPKFESNLRAKVRIFGTSTATKGPIDRAAGTLRELQEEISKSAPAPGVKREPDPVPVEIKQTPPTPLESLSGLVRPLLSPLATTALVILFLFFILLTREDLRDRFLRLAGTADLQRSTVALDDAAFRLSRFFLMQTALNTGFGAVIGLGLALIGVPNAILWGILAGLMRFVPFVGGFIAAFFPIALAAAVDPGWSMVLWTAALFLISEPIAGHVIEPLLYGQHTGLSPVAIVIATLFWTVLWGPVGLLLATPLTVCLVVLGKHVEALTFLDVLLGDEPPLKPEERFYQRLLAADATDAADQAERALKKQALSSYYDEVAMKALALAHADAAQGKLERETQTSLRDTIEEIIDDLSDHANEDPPPPKKKDGETADAPPRNPLPPVLTVDQLLPAWRVEYPVLCVAARRPLDESAALLLADLLGKHGVPAWVQPFADVSSVRRFKLDARDAPLVCVSYFGAAGTPTHVRYLIRRLRRAMPNARVLACFWMIGEDAEKLEKWRAAVAADIACGSLAEALTICVREATKSELDKRTTAALPDKRDGRRQLESE